jgi:hypothetical protein
MGFVVKAQENVLKMSCSELIKSAVHDSATKSILMWEPQTYTASRQKAHLHGQFQRQIFH